MPAPGAPHCQSKTPDVGGVTAGQHSDHWTQRFSVRPWKLPGQEGPQGKLLQGQPGSGSALAESEGAPSPCAPQPS